MRRPEDFDKYDALALAERLLQVAQAKSHPKVASYDIILGTLREKMQVPREQFKAYFLALLAEKEYSGILDSISKVDKLFKKKDQGNQSKSRPAPGNFGTSTSRLTCWSCGQPGHRASQCYRRNNRWQPYRRQPSPYPALEASAASTYKRN